MGNKASNNMNLKLGKKRSKLIETLDEIGKSPEESHMEFTNKKKIVRTSFRRDKVNSNKSKEEKEEQKNLKVILKRNSELEDYEMLMNCFNANFFLKNLTPHIQKEAIKNITLCSVEKGVQLFEQGDYGQFFYVVAEGSFELEIDLTPVKKFTRGISFGDLALLHDDKRSGTVTALEDSKVWCLSRSNFKKIVDYFNKKNLNACENFINSVGILLTAPEDVKHLFSSKVVKETFEENEIVFKEGERANCFYLIESGHVKCTKEGNVMRRIKAGENFGLVSALSDGFRSLTVIAGEDTVLYSLSFEVLKEIIGENYKEILMRHFAKYYLSINPIFLHKSKEIVETVLDNIEIERYIGGEVIVRKGTEKVKKVFLVVEGGIAVAGKHFESFGRGQILFAKELLENKARNIADDLVAFPDCLAAVISVEKLEAIGVKIGGKGRRTSIELRESSLEKVKMFKMLSFNKFSELTRIVEKKFFCEGDKIIIEGEKGGSMFFIAEGEVSIWIDNTYVRTLGQSSYFGERCLFLNEPRSATVKAVSRVIAYELSKEGLNKVFDEEQIEFLRERLHLQDSSVQLEDLRVLKSLGEGSYGKVFKVENVRSKFNYAVKMLNVDQINIEKLHENIDLERKLLLKLNHPFVVKLVKTMKKDNFLFFLMEFIEGEDLFASLRVIGLLDKYQTQFYSACLLLMTKYLRENNIVFRDLKPENVMVCGNGYSKLIDFGTATVCTNRTFTIIGTPHYMAPEVLLGKGYSFSADMWSVGICIYEFMCGNLPFAPSASDPNKVYAAVLTEEYQYPKFIKDEKYRHLVRKMLNKNPLSRLVRFEDISEHPWFDDFSFTKVEEFKASVPYLPKIKKNTPDMNCTIENLINSDIFSKNLEDYSKKKMMKYRLKYEKWYKDF